MTKIKSISSNIILILILCVVFLFTSCTKLSSGQGMFSSQSNPSLIPEASSMNTDGRKTIQWGIPVIVEGSQMISENPFLKEEVAAVQEIVDAFCQSNQLEYFVHVVGIPVSMNVTIDAEGKGILPKQASVAEILASNPDLDIVTVTNITNLGNTRGLSAYEKAAKDGILYNLDELMRSETGKDLLAALGESQLGYCRIDRQLFGLAYTQSPFYNSINYNRALTEELGIKTEELKGNLTEQHPLFMQAKEAGFSPFMLQTQAYSTYVNGIDLIRFPNCPNLVMTSTGLRSYYDLPETKARLQLLSKWKEEGLVLSRGFSRTPLEKKLFATDSSIFSRTPTSSSFAEDDVRNFVDALNVPDLTHIIVSSTANNNVMAIKHDSLHVEAAFDWISKLLLEETLYRPLIEQGRKGSIIFFIGGLKPDLPEFLQLEAQAEHAFSETPFKGFRFDTTPVQTEVDACNQLVGPLAGFDETKLLPEVRAVYFLESPIEKNLEALRKLLEEAGMDKIVDEANHQYQEWLKLSGEGVE